MAGLGTYVQTKLAEDVEDMIYNISPVDNPVASMAGTSKATGKLHEWLEDTLAAAASNKSLEGADASFADPVTTTTRQNNCQIMQKTAQITGTLETVKKYGRTSEMAYQLAKRYSELANDEELAIMGAPGGVRQVGTPGAAGTAREMTSIHGQILNITDATGITTVPNLETKLLAAHLSCYTAGARPQYLFVPPSHAIYIAGFAASAGRTRQFDEGTKIVNVVDLYVSPYGELSVVLDRNITGGAIAMFLIDMNYLSTPILRATRDWPIAKTGDSEKRQILREATFASLNFRAHAIIDNIPAALGP